MNLKLNRRIKAFSIAYVVLLILARDILRSLSYVFLNLAPESNDSWYFCALIAVGCLIIGGYALGFKIINHFDPEKIQTEQKVRREPEIDFIPSEQTDFGHGYFPGNTASLTAPEEIPGEPPTVTLPSKLIPTKESADLEKESLKLQLANAITSLLKYQQIALQAQDTNIQQANEVAALLGGNRDFDDSVTEVGLAFQFDIDKIKLGLKPKKKVEMPQGYQLYTYILGALVIFYLWRNPTAVTALMQFASIQRNQMFIGVGLAFILVVFYGFGKWRGKW